MSKKVSSKSSKIVAAPQVSGPRVLWVAPEASPYASTGGLAEVTGALPPRLRQAGWDVRLLLPFHRLAAQNVLESEIVERTPMMLDLDGREYACEILHVEGRHGLPVLFLACDPLFDRVGIYAEGGLDYPDNHLRFGLLCRAAVELARRDKIDLLHLHDWPAALTAVMLATRYRDDPELSGVRTLLSIHNLAHPGPFLPHTLGELGLPGSLASYELMGHAGEISWLKGGLVFSDALSTVSPRYSREILTHEGGQGLEPVLLERRADLRGILNGLDFEEWNPATDQTLAATYSVEEPAGKAQCKSALQEEMDLKKVASRPLISFIGRLAPQKGMDLILESLPAILDKGAQVVILGSGHPDFEAELREAAEEYPGQVAAFIGFDRSLVRRILAGSDLTLMPSRFEPCGLTQMQAMRYGSIPLVHGVGGLLDTVKTVTPSALKKGDATGFVFKTFSKRAFVTSIGKALELYGKKAAWRGLVEQAMSEDWSWEAGLPDYERLYRRIEKRPIHRFGVDVPADAPGVEPGVAAEAAPEPYIDWGPEMPHRYGEDTLELMVQSPSLLYTYWELSGDTYAAVGGESSLQLRLHQGDDSQVLSANRGDFGDWWIQVEPGKSYRVELLTADGATILGSSERFSPRRHESDRTDVHWIAAEMRLKRFLAARYRRWGRGKDDKIDFDPRALLDPSSTPAGYPDFGKAPLKRKEES